jgi:hypothetical protein
MSNSKIQDLFLPLVLHGGDSALRCPVNRGREGCPEGNGAEESIGVLRSGAPSSGYSPLTPPFPLVTVASVHTHWLTRSNDVS